MNGVKPVVLISEVNGGWRLEAEDFGELCELIGLDVAREFSRCFVHSDRLTSLIAFMYYSMERNPPETVKFRRDLQTMVWFVVGTLREMATSIRALRAALRRRDLLDKDSGSWQHLRAMERRWEDTAFFRKMRDQVSSHVDVGIVDKGLAAIIAARQPVVVVESDGDKQRDISLRLGLETVFMGGDKNEADFAKFLEVVVADHETALLISEVFGEVLIRAGVPREVRQV